MLSIHAPWIRSQLWAVKYTQQRVFLNLSITGNFVSINNIEMKKLVVVLAIAILGITKSNAQSFGFGTVTADAGFGFGMYGIRAYSPVNQQEHTGLAIVGTLPSVNAEFGLLRLIGVGVHYRRGTYGGYAGGKIRGSDICGMVNLHLANKKDKFDLLIGAGYGISGFKTNTTTTEGINARGGILRIHVTPKLYFGKYVGMFFRVAYNKHMLNNNLELTDSSGKLWTEADGATWNMGGLEFNLGVAMKLALLGGNKEESK